MYIDYVREFFFFLFIWLLYGRFLVRWRFFLCYIFSSNIGVLGLVILFGYLGLEVGNEYIIFKILIIILILKNILLIF